MNFIRKSILDQKNTKLVVGALSIAFCFLWILWFRVTASFDGFLGELNLVLFGGLICVFVFSTIFNGFCKFNRYVAEHISDNRFVKRVAESRISSLIVAIMLSGVLSGSAMLYVFTMHNFQFVVVGLGFLTVVSWLSIFSMEGILKKQLAELSSAYVAVLVGALVMLCCQLFYILTAQDNNYGIWSDELFDHIKNTVNHPNTIFTNIARISVAFEANILALRQDDNVGNTMAAVILILSTSLLPFMGLSLFVRSVFEFCSKLLLHKSL